MRSSISPSAFDVIEHIEDQLQALSELSPRRAPGRYARRHGARLPVALERARRDQPSSAPLHGQDAARAGGAGRLAAVSTTYFNGFLLPVAVVHRRLDAASRTRRRAGVGSGAHAGAAEHGARMAASFRGSRDRDGLADPRRPLAGGRLPQAGMSPDAGAAPGPAPDPGTPSRPPAPARPARTRRPRVGARRPSGRVPQHLGLGRDPDAQRAARVREAQPERLRQHVLLGGGEVDAALVAQLLLRRLRSQRLHHRRQAAARAVAAGAVGARCSGSRRSA